MFGSFLTCYISFRDAKQLVENLVKNHNFKEEMIDTCYSFAKCLFECGNYAGNKARKA